MKLIPILDPLVKYYVGRGYQDGVQYSQLKTFFLLKYEIEHIDIAIKNLLETKSISIDPNSGSTNDPVYIRYNRATTTPMPMPEVHTLLIAEKPEPNPILHHILSLFDKEEESNDEYDPYDPPAVESTLTDFQRSEIKAILGAGKEQKSSFGLELERLHLSTYESDPTIRCNVTPDILNLGINQLTMSDLAKFRGYSKHYVYVFLVNGQLTNVNRNCYF